MAFDYFLTVPNIPGEVTATRFAGAIQVLSFSWGMSNSGSAASGTGSGSGKVSLSDFNIQKSFDRSSPLLMQSLVSGTHLPSVLLSLVKSNTGGSQPLLTYEFDQVLISSIQDSGSDSVPTESVSFAMVSAVVTYYYQNSDGSVTPIRFASSL